MSISLSGVQTCPKARYSTRVTHDFVGILEFIPIEASFVSTFPNYILNKSAGKLSKLPNEISFL